MKVYTEVDAFGVIGLKKRKHFEFFFMLPTGIISLEVKRSINYFLLLHNIL